MKYLQSSFDQTLTIRADEPMKAEWWVDASCAVHPDMKSHTGAVLTFGHGNGAVYATLSRQKLMTRSLTEAELVGVHNILPQVIWIKNFMEGQGINIGPAVIYQDNKSAILLEKNGHGSSGKRTRHLDIRYFFAKDCVESRDIVIEHCPTLEMIADFFTKPLQGSLFRKFRNLIMNCATDSSDSQAQRSVLSEHESDVVAKKPEPIPGLLKSERAAVGPEL